jgi:GTP-binding protein YchF
VKQVGITGAPYSGKTTFFNALTHAGATSGGGKANVAVVPVPDPRIDRLAELHASKKSVYAQLKFLDVAGLAKGAGLSAQILGALREVDALAIVVRAYGEDADPAAELADVALELALADLEALSGAAERARKKGRTGDKTARAEAEVLERAIALLEAGQPLRAGTWEPAELTLFRNYAPLTGKPVLVVLNTDDESAGEQADLAAKLAGALGGGGGEGLAVPARLEAEVGGMPPAEAAELLAEFGVTVGALPSVIAAAYRMLGLLTFLTTGEDESRAWELRQGATAPEAAGAIHSDLQRGFIRAEVVSYDDLITAGSWDGARTAGRLRVEGKDYVVAEGDVMNIRFAV